MSSGADAALKGFAYQIKVSIFAALRLLLIDNAANRLTLEPANEEDLEADINPDEPGRVVPIATTAQGYRLVIQVKLSNGDPWSVEMLERLLVKGTNRTPAKTHLEDPNCRYLLITTADATGVARDLLMSGFEDWPAAADFPPSLKSTLTQSPEGRVGILGGLRERVLDLELDALLGDLLRVPGARRPACLEQLQSEARFRMSGTSPGVWTRDDLQAVIRAHGGYLASGADRDSYVEPANHATIAGHLDRSHSVILAGPSGTGKTQTALALCDRARRQDGDVEIIVVDSSADPALVRSLSDTGPRLYYIEDPWGQNSLRGGSEAWTAQLPGILRSATARRQFIVTSRSDMLQQARAEPELQRWTVALEAKDYADGQLLEIYNRRMDRLPSEVQSQALFFREQVLGALETPLELDLFFTHLADGRSGSENDGEFLHRVLAVAHRDAVEGSVRAFLADNRYGPEAIVIWAILGSRGQVDRSRLALIERDLRRAGLTMTRGLIGVANRLVATRHLRQPIQTLAFAHPSVRAGFEAMVREDWLTTLDVLDPLLDALTRLDGQDRDWGVETAARVLLLLEGWPGANTDGPAYAPQEPVRARIDAWLEEALLDPGSDFGALLELAADVGSSASTPSEVSRWFMRGVRRGASWFLETWTAPVYADDWYVRIAADPRTRQIAARYIREQLPRESHVYTDDMPANLDRLATGLEADYIFAAQAIVGGGHELSSGAIAAGAVRDLDGFLPVLDAALDVQAQVRADYRQNGKPTWRAIEDGEHDEGFTDHFQAQHEDDGYVADRFVQAWIAAMRRAGRWQELEDHPRAIAFVHDWALMMLGPTPPPSRDEMEAVFRCVRTDADRAAAWRVVSAHWDQAFAGRLSQGLLEFPADDDFRQALAGCAVGADPHLLADVVRRTTDSGQLVQLATDVRRAISWRDARVHINTLRAAFAAGPRGGRELLRAMPTRKRVRPPSSAALELAEIAAETARSATLADLVTMLIASGRRPIAAVRRLLEETSDYRLAERAAEAAATLADTELLSEALAHPRASARRVALVALGESSPGPLSAELLAMANDPGSGVRTALSKLLATQARPEYLDTLLKLSGDTWSDDEPHYDRSPRFPIARRAVEALGAYEALDGRATDRLIDLGLATADLALRESAFAVAADRGGPEARDRLWNEIVRGAGRLPRRPAVIALAKARVVESSLIDKVPAGALLSAPPLLAAALAFLMGRHAPIPSAVETFTEVFQSRERRSLMIVGARALLDRDVAAAGRLMSLLGSDHPARQLLTISTPLAPATVLDALGNVEVRAAVRPYLSGLLAS